MTNNQGDSLVRPLLQQIREQLQPRLTARNVKEVGSHYELREQETAYNAHFTPENGHLSTENMFYFGLNDEQSRG